MDNVIEFLQWEKASRDTIDVKRIYIDIAGELVAGFLLSQIIYWNLPDDSGHSKLRVEKQGRLWLAKKREDWWQECRITPKQFDRAVKVLVSQSIIEVKRFMFDGHPTIHIWLNAENLYQRVKCILTKGQYGTSPKVNMELPQRSNCITETTTEITTKTTATTKGNLTIKDIEIDKLNELRQEFTDLDFEEEMKQCDMWWANSAKKKLKNPSLALRKWLVKARRYKITENQHRGNNKLPALALPSTEELAASWGVK